MPWSRALCNIATILNGREESGRRRNSGKRHESHVGRFGPTTMTEAVAAVVAVDEASNYRKVSTTASEYE